MRQTAGAFIQIGLELLGGRPSSSAVVERIEAVNVAGLDHRFVAGAIRRRHLGRTARRRRGHGQSSGDARQNPLPVHVIRLAL
ncbi:hypothetical protein D3C81_1924730 [compost metagenome]